MSIVDDSSAKGRPLMADEDILGAGGVVRAPHVQTRRGDRTRGANRHRVRVEPPSPHGREEDRGDGARTQSRPSRETDIATRARVRDDPAPEDADAESARGRHEENQQETAHLC